MDKRRLAPPSMLVVSLLVLVGCSNLIQDVGARDIDIGGPVGEGRSLPAHETAWFGTNILNVTTDASLTLMELVPVGLTGQDYETFYMPIEGTEGSTGIATDQELPEANRVNAVPLGRITVSKASGNFQLLVRTSVPTGGLSVHGYWLKYSVGSDTFQTFIPRSQHICEGPPGQVGCPEFEPSK